MLCNECDNPLPSQLTSTTICSKCKIPLSTWWDTSSQSYRVNRESILPASELLGTNSRVVGGSPYSSVGIGGKFESLILSGKMDGVGRAWNEEGRGRRRVNRDSIEERSFQGALIMLEGHFERPQTYMAAAMGEVKKLVAVTLDMSLNKADVRETLAKNVSVWMRLQRIFHLATPLLERRSLSSTQNESGHSINQDVPESAVLILKNCDLLREDLQFLNSLLVISRNMLAIKETAQEICGAVGFDREVKRLVELCVAVTSKGYDGENVVEGDRGKLLEITELYKKVLVTCLQHTHNWTMGSDRFKMSFWFEMLFDDEWKTDPVHELPPDDMNVRNVYEEVKNWLFRHSQKDPAAGDLLDKYTEELEYGNNPGPLPILEGVNRESELTYVEENTSPVWKADLHDKVEQDRLYARVSHEIDIWWKRVRDANYEGWVVPMETVEGAQQRAEACKETAMHRYMPRGQDHENYEQEDHYDEQRNEGKIDHEEVDNRSTREDNGEDDVEEEEEEDDDDSYVEGPLRGLLTEIPNILDTKQIEALHMTIKACVVDSMGSGLTPAGENLQKTRCKMLLALDCGKNLLREMLVFIAVWEQTDSQFIFQITAQIIESFHHNALLPYAWNSLRILKDIVSPAQTVLLRLINYMFRARKDSPIYDDLRDYNRDAKLIHFLYNYFRCRVVPDCIALISAQAQIRQGKKHPGDFPVDLWDMERAKDGLSQYLDFISVIAEIPEMRPLLIEWESVYELVALLKALEQGVARKSLDERSMPGPSRRAPQATSPSTAPAITNLYDDTNLTQTPQPSLPPMHDTPHKYPWTGIKNQILIILTSLLAPPNQRRTGPGNPIVQKQLLFHEGIMPLLNCCVYDGHNEYLKERATLAIKFCMEGCIEAQNYVKDLVPVKQAQAKAQQQAQAHLVAQQQQERLKAEAGNVQAGVAKQTARAGVNTLPGRAKVEGLADGGGGSAGDGSGKNISELEVAKQMLREKGHVVEGDEEARKLFGGATGEKVA